MKWWLKTEAKHRTCIKCWPSPLCIEKMSFARNAAPRSRLRSSNLKGWIVNLQPALWRKSFIWHTTRKEGKVKTWSWQTQVPHWTLFCSEDTWDKNLTAQQNKEGQHILCWGCWGRNRLKSRRSWVVQDSKVPLALFSQCIATNSVCITLCCK